MLNSLQWRHNGHDGVLNQQPHHCLLNLLFRCISKKISKLRVTGLSAGKSPTTDEFPAQRASKVENVSIWWRHHVLMIHWILNSHNDVTTWKCFPLWIETTSSRWIPLAKEQWCGALILALLLAWTRCSTNSWESCNIDTGNAFLPSGNIVQEHQVKNHANLKKKI